MVLIKGPDAMAGSIFIFLNTIGIIAPLNPEIIIAATNAKPIHPETANANSIGFPLTNQIYTPIIPNPKIPSNTPFENPIRVS